MLREQSMTDQSESFETAPVGISRMSRGGCTSVGPMASRERGTIPWLF